MHFGISTKSHHNSFLSWIIFDYVKGSNVGYWNAKEKRAVLHTSVQYYFGTEDSLRCVFKVSNIFACMKKVKVVYENTNEEKHSTCILCNIESLYRKDIMTHFLNLYTCWLHEKNKCTIL